MIKMPKVYNTDNGKDKVVGFKKEAETIIDQLIHGPKERDIVLITGMGGLGKTTLARRVYDEKRVVSYFDNSAWCTVSQEYDYTGLLHKIYSQVGDSETQVGDVAEKLRKSLMGKRYLIVLDDIWSAQAWEELNRVFPSCDEGSRIVLTSRQDNLVSEAKHICLPFFTIDESWELLEVKLFKGERCPEELENIGREISKKCGGVPLVVSLVAGLLEGIEKDEQMWHEFLLKLNSHSAFKDGIQSKEVIELSYKHLSDHLKSCLLYFAAFPEDTEIEASYLIELWIAEGHGEIMEDGAEDYLNHLIGSNLIIVSERNYDGHIVTCIVHDLVHDFCLIKAKEEDFLHAIKLENDTGPTMNFSPRRICFHRYGGHKAPSELVPWNNSSIHTLLGSKIGNKSEDASNVYRGSWMAKKFENLTTLDLAFIFVDKSILSEVNTLIHLRYLSLHLQGSGSVSPFSLGNLECLITLKMESHGLHLPKIFWNMRSLRHMFINHFCSDSCIEESVPVIETAPNSEILQTYKVLGPLSIKDEPLLRKLTRLKNLKCCVSRTYQFFEIGFLNHLETVELHGTPRSPHSVEDLRLDKFPSSIKEICLESFILSSSAMSIIAELSCLEALTLNDCWFKRDEWIVDEETQFPKLKYLKLSNGGVIKRWSACAESFPCLERLVLIGLALREVPSSLADILTLEVIYVGDGYHNVAICLEKILEEAREMGNEKLKVEIDLPAKERVMYRFMKLMGPSGMTFTLPKEGSPFRSRGRRHIAKPQVMHWRRQGKTNRQDTNLWMPNDMMFTHSVILSFL